MGFQLCTVVRDDDEDAAVAEAQAAYDAAVEARNKLGSSHPRLAMSAPTDQETLAQAEVELAAEALYDAKKSEFEMTAATMEDTLALMTMHDMFDQASQEPPWPDPVDYGLTAAEAAPAHDMSIPPSELPQQLHQYRAALDALTRQTSDLPTGIPAYKLSSNNGWLVTPDELTAALAAAGTRDAHPDISWWRDWIDWLDYARTHHGIRVY